MYSDKNVSVCLKTIMCIVIANVSVCLRNLIHVYSDKNVSVCLKTIMCPSDKNVSVCLKTIMCIVIKMFQFAFNTIDVYSDTKHVVSLP